MHDQNPPSGPHRLIGSSGHFEYTFLIDTCYQAWRGQGRLETLWTRCPNRGLQWCVTSPMWWQSSWLEALWVGCAVGWPESTASSGDHGEVAKEEDGCFSVGAAEFRVIPKRPGVGSHTCMHAFNHSNTHASQPKRQWFAYQDRVSYCGVGCQGVLAAREGRVPCLCKAGAYHSVVLVAKGCWLLEREEYHACARPARIILWEGRRKILQCLDRIYSVNR
jgi:hypothetical protein